MLGQMRRSCSLESFHDGQEQLRAGMGIASEDEDEMYTSARKLPAISSLSSSPSSGAPQPRREWKRRASDPGLRIRVPHHAPPARLADHRARRRRGPPRGQDFCRTIKADDDSSVASDNTEPSLMSPGLGRRQLEAASMHSDYGDDASSRDGGSESTEEENCAVRIARSNELAQAEHKRIVRQSWREFEERVVATFGAEHDRIPADGAPMRDAEVVVIELYGWSGVRGKIGKKAERHLKALGRNLELANLLGLRGRNPAAETRLHALSPKDRFDLAAGSSPKAARGIHARSTRDHILAVG